MNNKNKLPREAIAMRVTKELHNGNVVNLGIGIPTSVSYTHLTLPTNREV